MQPHWYKLESRRKGAKRKGDVSGEVQLQFSLADASNPAASSQDLLQKLASVIAMSPEDDDDASDDEVISKLDSLGLDEDDDEDETEDKTPDTSDEADSAAKPEKGEKRKKKLRMKRLKKKAKARAYEFTGATNVVGVVFLEIVKITDLPPERNSKAISLCLKTNSTEISCSNKDWLRYGSIRSSLIRSENLSYKGHPTQPEPSLRRKDGVSSVKA